MDLKGSRMENWSRGLATLRLARALCLCAGQQSRQKGANRATSARNFRTCARKKVYNAYLYLKYRVCMSRTIVERAYEMSFVSDRTNQVQHLSRS